MTKHIMKKFALLLLLDISLSLTISMIPSYCSVTLRVGASQSHHTTAKSSGMIASMTDRFEFRRIVKVIYAAPCDRDSCVVTLP